MPRSYIIFFTNSKEIFGRTNFLAMYLHFLTNFIFIPIEIGGDEIAVVPVFYVESEEVH